MQKFSRKIFSNGRFSEITVHRSQESEERQSATIELVVISFLLLCKVHFMLNFLLRWRSRRLAGDVFQYKF